MSISYNKDGEYVCPTDENKDNKPEDGFYTDCQDLTSPFYKSTKISRNRPDSNLYDSTYDNPELYQSLNECEDGFLNQKNQNKIIISKPGQDYTNYPIDPIMKNTTDIDSTPDYAALSQIPADNIYAATAERRKSKEYTLLEGQQTPDELQDTYATLESNSDMYAALEERDDSFNKKDETYQTLQDGSNDGINFSKYVGW